MRFNQLSQWLHADEVATDGRGWSVNLDIFRIVFLGTCVLPWALRNLIWIESVFPHLPRDVWAPISFYRLIPLDLLRNASVIPTLAVTNVVLIVLGVIGFYTRTSIGIATLLSVYLFGLVENQGKIDHFHHIIWFMTLLAVGPSGRFLSIDSIRRAFKNADRGFVEVPPQHFEALSTLRYMWLLMGLLYLVPGLAKLEKAYTSGWASASNLQHILWRKWFELALYSRGAMLPIRVDRLPAWMLEIAGIAAILFEVGFLFIVLFRRLRPIATLSGLAFHTGNGLILNIWFTTLMPAYVGLIDWYALGRNERHSNKAPLIVLYDGQCRLCRRTIAVLKSVDLFDALEPRAVAIPSHSSALEPYPGVTYEMLSHDLYVIAGSSMAGGYDAYVRIAQRLVLLFPVALIMRWPPVATQGRRVYRRVADSRSCSIVIPPPIKRIPISTTRLIHPIGVVFLAFQMGVSGIMFLNNELTGFTARLPSLANRLVVGVGRRKPVWPFDMYPTFASPTPGEAVIWEPHWVTSSGHEERISPKVYDAAFGSSGLMWTIVSDTHDEARTRSLDLVRVLWLSESASIKQRVTAVKIYRSRYRLEPPEQGFGKLINADLLDSFPVDEVSQYRDSTLQ